MSISIERQIKCVEREIAYRKRVYPGLIERGRMHQVNADFQIEAMKAVLKTLKALAPEGEQQSLFLAETNVKLPFGEDNHADYPGND